MVGCSLIPWIDHCVSHVTAGLTSLAGGAILVSRMQCGNKLLCRLLVWIVSKCIAILFLALSGWKIQWLVFVCSADPALTRGTAALHCTPGVCLELGVVAVQLVWFVWFPACT